MTTETLLDSVVYGEPSGNYDGSSQDWASDAAKAAGYYQGRGGVQTVRFVVDEFVGTIRIEATLDSDAATATWFTVLDYGDADTATTATQSETAVGNFTWLRAHVLGFDAGTIESVSVTY